MKSIYKRFGRHVWHNRHANTALREREVGTAQCSVSRFAHSTRREIITWRTRPRPASATLCRQTSFHRLAARFRSYFYTIRPFAPFVTALQNKFIYASCTHISTYIRIESLHNHQNHINRSSYRVVRFVANYIRIRLS